LLDDRRGLRSSAAKSWNAPELSGPRVRTGGGGDDGWSIASEASHEAQVVVPMALYQSHRPQTIPSSKAIRSESAYQERRGATHHQIMLSRFLVSPKPAALTRRKTMC
jgi:hypothetical protein